MDPAHVEDPIVFVCDFYCPSYLALLFSILDTLDPLLDRYAHNAHTAHTLRTHTHRQAHVREQLAPVRHLAHTFQVHRHEDGTCGHGELLRARG